MFDQPDALRRLLDKEEIRDALLRRMFSSKIVWQASKHGRRSAVEG